MERRCAEPEPSRGQQCRCALSDTLAELGQEDKALLWGFERGASACPVQLRDPCCWQGEAVEAASEGLARNGGLFLSADPPPRAHEMKTGRAGCRLLLSLG